MWMRLKGCHSVATTFEVATDIEGAIPRNSLTISEEQGDYLQKLITPHHITVDLPDEVVVENMEELTTMKATLRYSDGSSRQAGIDWFDLPASATEKAFVAKGQVHQEHFLSRLRLIARILVSANGKGILLYCHE